MVVIEADGSLENADWQRKNRWDLFYDDELVTTVVGLLGVLDVEAKDYREQVIEVKHFLTLPAAEAMPKKLLKEVKGWLTKLS